MAIIRLTTCDNLIEAYFIKNNLENEDIECFLTNEISSTLLPIYSRLLNAGVQVMINEKDLETALKLIEKPDLDKPVLCPDCSSANIKFGFGEKKGWKIPVVVLSLLIGIPFGNINRNYVCKDCKAEF
jgi:hypothetical protein